MASSTISPVASTSASSVSKLIEKPISQMPAITPTSATGMVALGTTVGRQARKNTSMVPMTTAMVNASVISTSRTEMRMNCASSDATSIRTSSNRAFRRSTSARMALDISIVFELACRTTPSPTIGAPSRRTKLVALAGAKSACATSPTRVVPEMTTFSICAGSTALASARTTSSCASDRNEPTGTSKGAPRSAAATSVIVSPKRLSRAGSTDTRICRARVPNCSMLATPSAASSSGTMSFSTSRVSEAWS